MNDENYACCPSHCCDKHGCKYGMRGCPVVKGTKKQLYPCETCGLTESGYYDGNEFGYYDSDMVWHPPAGSEEHTREVEDRILARVAAYLRSRGLRSEADAVETRAFESDG